MAQYADFYIMPPQQKAAQTEREAKLGNARDHLVIQALLFLQVLSDL